MTELRINKIERGETVKIRVNNKEMSAYRGETVLAALLAAGYRSIKKSVIKGEPRGALCGMGVCYECVITLNGVPGVRACMVEVEDQMEITIDDGA